MNILKYMSLKKYREYFPNFKKPDFVFKKNLKKKDINI